MNNMANSTNKGFGNYKFDLNDDVDDRTFLANSRPKFAPAPSYNTPSSATAEFERKQQLLMQQKNKLEDECLKSTKNSLILINESEHIGIKTGEELLEQKEKLGRIENDLDTMAGVSRQSQKHLNAMNSGVVSFMYGGFKSMFKKDKSKTPTTPVQPSPPRMTSSQSANDFKNSELNNTMSKLRSNSTTYDPNQFTRPAPIPEDDRAQMQRQAAPKKDFNQRIDDDLLQMQSGISRLKDLALGMGKEIEQQNETLDVITNKADKTNTTLKVQNKQILKKLGK